MPTTPNFAIPYPCAGDVIDADVIAAYTNGVDAALASVASAAQDALTRPSIGVKTVATGEVIATGVATNLTFTTVIHNEGLTAAVPTTTVTVNEAGMYRVNATIVSASLATTITRFRMVVNFSTGRRLSRNVAFTPALTLTQPEPAFGLIRCPAATTVTLQAQWVGTGGPIQIAGALFLNKFCDL